MNLVKNLKSLIVLLFAVLVAGNSWSADGATLTTDGTLTFTVRTLSNNATYSPRNVLAIWIKDAQGNFIISRKVMAANRKQHLVKWVASSSNNVVNAITGATLSNHQTHTISWDCRDLNGNLVPDGNYEIWVEFTERNSNSGGAVGPSTKVVFTKGTEVTSPVIADESFFKNMELVYTPLNVGISDDIKSLISFVAFPNPFNTNLNVSFDLPESDFVNVSVYDLSGKRMVELVNQDLPRGANSFSWDAKMGNGQKLTSGVYSIRIVYQGKMFMHKVVFSN
ncbi:MAG: DUF2271 domain-containing protein [Lentimicrobium sp.]|nr:DUF2271 domain-containing protein [Lentimicrobium sp.]